MNGTFAGSGNEAGSTSSGYNTTYTVPTGGFAAFASTGQAASHVDATPASVNVDSSHAGAFQGFTGGGASITGTDQTFAQAAGNAQYTATGNFDATTQRTFTNYQQPAAGDQAQVNIGTTTTELSGPFTGQGAETANTASGFGRDVSLPSGSSVAYASLGQAAAHIDTTPFEVNAASAHSGGYQASANGGTTFSGTDQTFAQGNGTGQYTGNGTFTSNAQTYYQNTNTQTPPDVPAPNNAPTTGGAGGTGGTGGTGTPIIIDQPN